MTPRDLSILLEEVQQQKELDAARDAARALWGAGGWAIYLEGNERPFQVGVRRAVKLARKGFRTKTTEGFVALGWGDSWEAAFDEAEVNRARMERELGAKGIATAKRILRDAGKLPKPRS